MNKEELGKQICPRCKSENYQFVRVNITKYFTGLVIACKDCEYCPHYDD